MSECIPHYSNKKGKHRARGDEGRRLTLIKNTDALCKRCNSKQFPVQPLTDMQTVDSRFKILNLIRNPPKGRPNASINYHLLPL